MKRVLVFAERMLPSTQTFIPLQVNELQRYSPQYVGLIPADRNQTLPHTPVMLTHDRGPVSRIRRELYRWTGIAPSFHARVREKNADLLHAHFAEGGSADGVLPQFQGLAVGDPVPLGPGTALRAVTVDAPRALVLQMAMNPLHGTPSTTGDRARLDWSWAFVLVPRGTGCRLLVRVRADYRPRVVGLAVPLLLEPVHLLMETTMLRGIARRATRTG